MGPQNRSGRQRADLTIKACLDRSRFAGIGHNANDFFGLQDLAYGHGNCSLGNSGKTLEPSFTDLLLSARFVEMDDDVRFFGLEIGGRIIESQMPILTDPDESYIDGRQSKKEEITKTMPTSTNSLLRDMFCCPTKRGFRQWESMTSQRNTWLSGSNACAPANSLIARCRTDLLTQWHALWQRSRIGRAKSSIGMSPAKQLGITPSRHLIFRIRSNGVTKLLVFKFLLSAHSQKSPCVAVD
jgi:hypothetical protein